jgi:type IV pilus assembly protein PilV
MMITTRPSEKGFSLIEVLVSLLVLSVGLFGMLAIIITSMQMNSSSVYRTIAAEQAYAMAEVLRANPTTLWTVDTSVASAFSSATPGVATTCLQSSLSGCGRGTSGANGFVQMSVAMWQTQLASLLPAGAGTVCQDSTPNDGTPTNWLCDGASGTSNNAPYVVKVCWNESRIIASSSVTGSSTSGSGGALCTYTNL